MTQDLNRALRTKLKKGALSTKTLRKILKIEHGTGKTKAEFKVLFESALAAASPAVQVNDDGIASYSKKRTREDIGATEDARNVKKTLCCSVETKPGDGEISLKRVLRMKLKKEGSMPIKKLRKKIRKEFVGTKANFQKEFEAALVAAASFVQIDEDGVASYNKKKRDKNGGTGECSEPQVRIDSEGDDDGHKNPSANSQLEAANNPNNDTRLFVGNLSFKIDEASLQQALMPNTITHFKWLTDKESGQFYGSGFIEMATAAEAARAVAMAGMEVLGRPLKINYAPPRPGDIWPPNNKAQAATREMSKKPVGCRKLFAGNLSYDIDDDKLYEFFGDAGNALLSIRYLTHRDSGDFKGCAFLEFSSTRDADAAAQKNGDLLLDRPIRLDWDQ